MPYFFGDINFWRYFHWLSTDLLRFIAISVTNDSIKAIWHAYHSLIDSIFFTIAFRKENDTFYASVCHLCWFTLPRLNYHYLLHRFRRNVQIFKSHPEKIHAM